MTHSEENYLKSIYLLSKEKKKGVSTSEIAEMVNAKASSVTEMVKKLADKKCLNYRKYQGVTLTELGRKHALKIIRKHRLWEVFLVEKLNFSWDEVHEVAEQLEHIQSEKLILELDNFLGQPKSDPHGDPIPDRNGNYYHTEKILLSELSVGESGVCVGVKNTSSEFLQFLDKLSISLGMEIRVMEKESFDQSMRIMINGEEVSISSKISTNLFVQTNV